ncbi:MAG: magnesium transporter [Candidatus Pacearchaeota archaeon]
MRLIKKYLQKLSNIPRRKNHPLTHKIHSEHNISKKTLLYIKEYGPHSNIPTTIISESVKVLLLTSLISSLGGFSLEYIKESFIPLMPLIVLLPVLNGMIGNYGAIISSRFSTIIHKNGSLSGGFKNNELKVLYLQIKVISLIIVVFASLLSFVISYLVFGEFNFFIMGKIFIIACMDILILINVLFFISVYFGIYFYNKGEDPDNFLIPITTSIADFGNMVFLSLLIILFF